MSYIPPLGLFYLIPSYKQEPPPSIVFPAGKGLHNPNMDGLVWRETWDRLDPNGTGPIFTWLDAGVNATQAAGKLSGMECLPGSSAPAWFYNTYPNEILTTLAYGRTTVPWTPQFQSHWEAVQIDLATRYDGRIKYMLIGGPGHSSESFLVNPGSNAAHDQAAADTLARAFGYPDAATAWQAGVVWLIDMYMRHWPNTPIMLSTGTPFPPPVDGQGALQAMFNYGDAVYQGRFGARADDLTAQQPQPGDPAALDIQQLSPHCIATGFQFGNHQNANDPAPPTRLGQALTRGISFGAHFIELFADDADDPVSVPVLITARQTMPGITTNTPSEVSNLHLI